MSEIPIGDSFRERLLQIADYPTCIQIVFRDTPAVGYEDQQRNIKKKNKGPDDFSRCKQRRACK